MMLLAMVLSSIALSNQTGSGKINYLQNGYNGWLFSIDDSNNNPDNCPKPTMKLNSEMGQYKEVFSLLLAAYVTGKPVIILTKGECDTDGYNVVSMVYTKWNS
jgi:hypothetical protein